MRGPCVLRAQCAISRTYLTLGEEYFILSFGSPAPFSAGVHKPVGLCRVPSRDMHAISHMVYGYFFSRPPRKEGLEESPADHSVQPTDAVYAPLPRIAR